ncbi:MAG: 2-amino-4-hydroxy-6-hydroxymethyldihydropteridine diphosphokinase [Alistipes sp.]|nr:2-amino-4-hydroxy-6-hydroxymethyldihydropteridine diphosphokinase [Alistipes sp.]
MATEVTLLLGSNDIEAKEIIERATGIINMSVGRILRRSEDYTSEPYGFSAERGFINRAVVIETTFDAYSLLQRINLIEALLGRDREEEARIKRERNEDYASRPIDIDIIFYGTETFHDRRLTIPYHFLAERGYALRPVAEVVPDFKHPALGATPREMLDNLKE